MSPISDARKRANKKWNDANMKERYDRIQLVLPKGQKGVIQTAAAACGESVNAFVGRAISELMEREASAVSPEDTGGSSGISTGSPEDNICSRFISQWGPDFKTALSASGQTAEEFISQAVRERVVRECNPLIPKWIAARYPGEKWPVLKAEQEIRSDLKAQRRLRHSMTLEQAAEWDKEFKRELEEARQEGATPEPPKRPTCNLPLDDFDF